MMGKLWRLEQNFNALAEEKGFSRLGDNRNKPRIKRNVRTDFCSLRSLQKGSLARVLDQL